MKKDIKDTKEKLFEMMQTLNPEMDNSWAVFRVKSGEKCYVTSINKHFRGQLSIGTCHYGIKYSDPTVLKFSLEEAKKIVEDNYSFYDKLGIVNNKGVQLGLGKYDKVWQKI